MISNNQQAMEAMISSSSSTKARPWCMLMLCRTFKKHRYWKVDDAADIPEGFLFGEQKQRTSTGIKDPFIKPKIAMLRMQMEKDPQTLVDIFMDAANHHRFDRFADAYTLAVSKLIRWNRLDAVETILEYDRTLTANPLNPRHHRYHGLMRRYVQLYAMAGMTENMLKVLREFPFSPTTRILNTTLMHLLSLGHYGRVRELFTEYVVDKGVTPNLYTLNFLIEAHCHLGESTRAFALVDKMNSYHLRPDIDTFNLLLEGFFTENKPDEAERVLKRIVVYGIHPNNTTHNLRISALCKERNSADALALFNHLCARGMLPTVETFNIIVKGFCDEKKLAEADGVIADLEARGYEPDENTFFAFLEGLCKWKDFPWACKIFFCCLRKNWVPAFQVTKALIEGLVGIRKFGDAREVIYHANRRYLPRVCVELGEVEKRISHELGEDERKVFPHFHKYAKW